MFKGDIPLLRNQALIGVTLFLVGMWIAWQVGGKIIAGDLEGIVFAALGFGACVVGFTILRNWRAGFYLFLIWLLFEDLARKYLGNDLVLFFGKDVLAALVYIALFVEIRRGREKTFRPPFLLPLVVFIWLGAVQIFNQNSPHILYGLLGFKVYFFYIPLMWAGYALIRDDNDLRRFLIANAVPAIVISAVGIAQAVLGNSFLNPRVLAPELQELGDLNKVTPLTNQIFNLPDSVFVSAGRFGFYLIMAFIIVLGAAGYLLLQGRKGRKIIFPAIAILGGAALFSGSRGAVVYCAASTLVLAVGFLWGAPWRWGQAYRLVKAIRRSFIVGALAIAALLLLFPDEAGSRIAYYMETLMPSSSAYAVTVRSWDYPIYNLMLVFSEPNWILGNGIGIASLGAQYVAKLVHQPLPSLWVEEGYGVLIIELGIVAPFLWLIWTGALLYCSWKVVRQLRETRFFPIALAIFWYAFLLLYPLTYGGLAPYQNYICNAFLWLLIGVLFRLPDIVANTQPTTVVGVQKRRTRRFFP
jgi:hypothetical protein